jgi:glycosyltransferase involved in cell wall biosynthesis
MQDFEVIIVDDCSTDTTSAIARRYCEIDSRFRYVRTPSNSNLPARARNVGIELAKGEYIAFLDHDDLWRPRKLERQIHVLETYPDVALVHSHLWDFTPRSKFVGLVLLPNPYRRRGSYQVLRRHNVVQCSSAMVRSEVLRDLAGFDERHELRAVEDYHLWMRIAKEHTIAYISEVHGDYRWLRSGTSRQDNLESKHQILDQVASAMIIESDPSTYRRVARKFAGYPLAIYFHLLEGPLRQLVGASPRVWIGRDIDDH